MKLTKPQYTLLLDIYNDAQNDDDRRMWTEPAKTDHPRTIAALVKHKMLFVANDGLFRMTDKGIKYIHNINQESEPCGD